MIANILTTAENLGETRIAIGYVFGIIVSLFIFFYLIYALLKPEKF